VIDEGCPHGRGRVAAQILTERHPGLPARLLCLPDAIEQERPVTPSVQRAAVA